MDLSSFTADDIIIIEIFCGTAGVTASFKRHGFSNAIAVDKMKQAGMLAGVISLDFDFTSRSTFNFAMA